MLDEDAHGTIGYAELRDGLARAVRPPIIVSLHDWERLTAAAGRDKGDDGGAGGGCGCGAEERVGPARFRAILRAELRAHVEGLLAAAMGATSRAGFEHAAVAALKLLLIRSEAAAEAAVVTREEEGEGEKAGTCACAAPPDPGPSAEGGGGRTRSGSRSYDEVRSTAAIVADADVEAFKPPAGGLAWPLERTSAGSLPPTTLSRSPPPLPILPLLTLAGAAATAVAGWRRK